MRSFIVAECSSLTKKIFLFQAKYLSRICGAKVELKITSKRGNVSTYYSEEKEYRNCGVQVGQPTLPPVRSSVRNAPPKVQTPQKLRKSSCTITKPTPVVNLPGKYASANKQNGKKQVSSKCEFCNIAYNSKADKEFKRMHGARKSTWVGCDHESCKFLAHVKRSGMILVPPKKG